MTPEEQEADDLACMFPHLAPSTGYSYGCRCPARCVAWREAYDRPRAEKQNAAKREKRRLRRQT